jgi:hypothetical protein
VASGQTSRSLLPWGVALVASLALVIAVAVQRSGAPASAGGAPLGSAAPIAPFAGGSGGAVRAPDISALSPRERADRLYDRVMRLASENKTDSATFFASMAVGAYEALAPLDLDLRYDYGRMAEMSGNLALAQSQADSILREAPDHLLGLILAARVAQLKGDTAGQRRYLARMLGAQSTELAKQLEEYERHRGDIDAAAAEARGNR